MIVRLLLLAGLGWLVWRFIQQWQAKLQRPPAQDAPPVYELMQRCTDCGAYLPSKALSRSGRCGRCSD